ncbi:MAG: hypothetical protein CM15mP89_4400 [Gammaproteobacteria bacterium]|nr:MAG: hypothetical protein CM15mP89_4400 [Gammaproteobacteria bacterium]
MRRAGAQEAAWRPVLKWSSIKVPQLSATTAYGHGVRDTVPANLSYSGATFDEVTAGSIRGHAAGTDALAVAASELCVDGLTADYAGCSALSIASYSSDGEAAARARFFGKATVRAVIKRLMVVSRYPSPI